MLDDRPTERVAAALWAAGCVFADDEAQLLVAEAADAGELEALVARRIEGEPLEWILGWAAFGRLRISVGPGVFVPRRRSELLARSAVDATVPGDGRPSTVVELCCGSGAVLRAVAETVADGEFIAADIDPVAVSCAAINLKGIATVLQSDLFDRLPRELAGRVAVLVANAPYVPSAEIPSMPTEARDHEPLVALDGGVDGLTVARRIVAEAPVWLRPGGRLLIESGERQATALEWAMRAAGLQTAVVRDDDVDATVVVGTAPGG